MKIIQIGDIHISETRINEFEILLKQLTDRIKEKNPDLIINTGDMFVHRDRLTPKQVELARILVKEHLKDYLCLTTIGNHDISMNEEKIDSISAIFTSDTKIYSVIGEYEDIKDYRFHFFPYPSKKELTRLGVKDPAELYTHKILKEFKIDPNKKNVLVYHGVLEGFNDKASEEALSIGKNLVVPESFWGKFDAVMAGHLHQYQKIKNAVYNGAPFPLTYADDFPMGFVFWEDLKPEFVELDPLYPFITIDIGDLSMYQKGITDEAERRIKNDYSYKNGRVRIKYIVNSSRSGELDHSVISRYFKDAKEVKISPTYINDEDNITVKFEDFQHHTVHEMIEKYIDSRKYHPKVKEISTEIEKRIKNKYVVEDPRGIHFKLLNLNINNFKCFGEHNKTIDFTKLNKIIGIFGPNKTGKSSLIEAIVWGLFGTTIRNKNVDSVIRNGQKHTKVEVTFQSHNEIYKVIRERGKPSNVRLLIKKEDSWIDITGGTAVQTQKNLEKIVGSFEIFISTVYSPQNSIDLLVKKKPDERKQIILECLQIDVIDNRRKEITQLRKEYRDTLNQEKGRMNTYSDEVTTLISSNPNETIEEFEQLIKTEKIELTRRQTHLNSLSKRLFEYEDLFLEFEDNNKKIIETREKVTEISAKIESKRKERTKLNNVIRDRTLLDVGLKNIEDLENEIKRYQDERIVNQARKQKLNELSIEHDQILERYDDTTLFINESRESTLKSIDGLSLLDCSKSDCPINLSVSTQKGNLRIELDKVDQKLQNIEEEKVIKLNDISRKVSRLNEEIKNSFYNFTTHKNKEKELQKEKSHKWIELKYKIDSGEDILSSLVELIAAYDNQAKSLRIEMSGMIQRRSDLSIKMASVDKYKKEIEKVRLDIDSFNSKIDNYNKQIYKAKHNLEEINTLQKKIIVTQEKIKDQESSIVFCNKYSEVVSKQGVIYAIVDKSIPVIEKFAQDILSESTDGLISLHIKSYRTLQSGERSEEIAIYIKDAKGQRDVLEASGAETVLVSLALRAAMAHLLSLRMGSKVELMIVDEGLGALDADNIVAVKTLFTNLSKKFNKILFITHVESLKDIAQTVINVSSNSLISKYTIEGEKEK